MMFEESTFLQDEDRVALSNAMNYNNSKLIYRYTETDQTPEAFHEKCDGKAPTVALFLTKRGRVWGAFTDIPWRNDGKFAKGKNNTFAFSFDAKNEL